MILSWMDQMYAMLFAGSWFALAGAFLWGSASVLLSPCHLSSIPLVMGFIGKESRGMQARAVFLSSVFTLGIMFSMLALGLVTAALGRMWGDVGLWVNWLAAAVFALVGLLLLDVIALPSMSIGNQERWRGRGAPAALVLGLLFGTVLGPCAFAFLMPVLGLVFANASQSPAYSAGLILAYALGHGAVIILAGSASAPMMKILQVPKNARIVLWMRKLVGVLSIGVGVWFVIK